MKTQIQKKKKTNLKSDTPLTMKRKKFIAAIGLLAGGSLAVPGRTFSYSGNRPVFRLPAGEEDLWKVVREEFSFPEGYTYLNTGGIGSVPRHVRSLVSDEWFRLESNPTPGHDLNRWNALKKDVAKLLGPGVEASEIALVSSATEGINIIINGLQLARGDEVITSLHEHPALNIPLLNAMKNRGIVLKFFEPDTRHGINNVKLISDLVTKKTKLIFISHRTTTTGQILPVGEIGALARAAGIRYALDGAQCPGSMPLDVKSYSADFYTFSSHKWLLAPRRTGVLFVRKEMLDTLDPVTTGAYSDNGYDLKKGRLSFQPTAQKFEYGTQNELLYYGFHASLKFLNAIGIEKIHNHNEELSEEFYRELGNIRNVEILSPSEREYRSSMITFRMHTVPMNDVTSAMASENIRVRPVGEAGLNGIRLSFHLYNTMEDVRTAIRCISNISP